jgi:cytochrome c oxidase assembly protein subunit 11
MTNEEQQEGENADRESEKKTKKTALSLAFVTVMMFGFAFAMVPLYELVCDIAGINSIESNSGRSELAVLSPDELAQATRTVTIQFDSTINGNMPWEFKPDAKTMTVKLGERTQTSYFFKNNSDKEIVTQSIPGVTPWQANQHLKKIECFCFETQTLQAGESKDMGLQFVIDQDLPEDIHTLTLSYTIMDTNRDDSLKTNKAKLPSVSAANDESADKDSKLAI